jgi:4-carboxymuconolactone decarboxylase
MKGDELTFEAFAKIAWNAKVVVECKPHRCPPPVTQGHFGQNGVVSKSKRTPIRKHDEHSAAYQRALTEMRRHLGPKAEEYLKPIKKLSPEFAWVNVMFPFGDLYSRHVVDIKTRELCTIAALTVQGSSLPQLAVHVSAALRVGNKRKEIIEVIMQMIPYCGFPAATNALKTAGGVFGALEPRRRRRRPLAT